MAKITHPTQRQRSRQRKKKEREVMEPLSGPGICAKCGRWVEHRDPSHIKHRGMGGNPKLDRTTASNIRSLCRECHTKYPGWGEGE